jgi:MFS family permease
LINGIEGNYATDILRKRIVLRFILLLGTVSLFADFTHEGARSVTGPYLAILGANAALVGFVAGLGEFIGQGMRIIFGFIADRTGRYWIIIIVGTILNLLVVPALALANSLDIAIILILAQRLGKAVRASPRDVLLSHAADAVGRGWGFGLHEAMDQTGAVLGPLIVSIVLYINGGYSQSFAILLAPAILSLVFLFLAKKLYPTPSDFETKTISHLIQKNNNNDIATQRSKRTFTGVFWFYIAFVAISVGGFANFQLISYHFKTTALLSNAQIPALYASAMGVEALTALAIGRLFDKKGILVVLLVPLLIIPITPLVFTNGGLGIVLIGIILWGGVLGIQETIMKATIANLTPTSRRGLVFGIFNAAYGISWFLGSTLMGVLYSISISYIILFSILAEVISIPIIFVVSHRFKSR